MSPLALPAGWPTLSRPGRISWLLEMALSGQIEPADAKRLASLIETAEAPPEKHPDAGTARQRLIDELDGLAREIPLDPTELVRAMVEDPRWPAIVVEQPLWAAIAEAYHLAPPAGQGDAEAKSDGS